MSLNPVLSLLMVACIALTGIELYMRRYNDLSAARRFRLILWLAFTWTFLYTANLATAEMPLKFVLVQLQMIPTIMMAPAILMFVVDYTGNPQWLTLRNIMVILFNPAFALAGLLLDPNRSTLFRYNFQLDTSGPLPLLLSEKGILYWIYVTIATVTILAAFWVLLSSSRNKSLGFKKPGWIAVGLMIPFVVNTLYIFGITPMRGIDFTPIAFIISGVFYLIAIRDFKIFDISPVARYSVMDNISDLVFVLDKSGLITDFNRAAQDACHLPDPVTALRTDSLPEPWAGFFHTYRTSSFCKTEISLIENETTCHYELNITPIQDSRKRVVGRLFILHDITAVTISQLSMQESEARFRGIYESSPIGIELYDHNGKLFHVNDACKEIFGLVDPTEIEGFDLFADPNIPEASKEKLRNREDVQVEIRFDFEVVKALSLYHTTKSGVIFLDLHITPLASDKWNIGFLVHVRDTTERKQMEVALRESEASIRSLIENMSDVIVRFDPDLRYTYMSPSIRKYYDIDPEEIVGKTYKEVGHPEQMENYIAENLKKVRDTRQPVDVEYESYVGTKRYFLETRIYPELDTYGNLKSLVAITRDVTARKNYELALAVSEKRYRLLAENITDVIWGLDVETLSFTYISPSVEWLRGYTPEEVMAQGMAASFTPASLAHIQSIMIDFSRRVTDGVPDIESFSTEIEHPCKDGSTVWTEAIIRFFTNPETGRLEIYGVSRDITERRKVALALRASEERYRTLVEVAPIGIVQTRNNRVVYANPAAQELSGYLSEDLVGSVPSDYVVSANLPDIDPTILEKEKSISYEIDLKRKDGSIASVLMARAILYDEKEGNSQIRFIQDITERKRAEEALRQSELTARTLLELPTTANLLLSPDGTIIDCNQTVARGLGTTREKMLGHVSWDFLPPDNAVSRKKYFDEALRTGQMVRWTDFRKDRWFENIFQPIRDASGQVTQVLTCGYDITELKRTSEALRASEEKFSKAFHSSPIGLILSTQAEGQIIDVNEAYCEISGFTRDDLIGKTTTGMNVWADPQDRARLIKTIAERGSVRSVEVLARKKSGDLCNLLVSMEPIELDGTPSFISFALDITDRKKVEDSLRLSEERFSKAFRTNPTAMIISRMDSGEILEVNEAFCEVTGYSREEFIGSTLVKVNIWENADARAQFLQLAQKTGFAMRGYETAVRTKSGELRNYMISLEQIVLQDTKCFIAAGIDITERKRAEVALRESEEKYRLLFETMAQGVVFQTTNGVIMSANYAAAEILGLNFEQMQGRTSIDPRWRAIHEDGTDFPGETHPAMVALATGQPVLNEIMGVYNSQSEKHHWLSVSAIPLFKPGEDKPYQVYTTFTDITKLKELQEQERELAALETRQALARDLHDAVSQTLFSARLTSEMLLRQRQTISEQALWQGVDHFTRLVVSALGEMRILLLELRPEGFVSTDLPTLLNHLLDATGSRTDAVISRDLQGKASLPLEVKKVFYRIAQEAINNIIKHASASRIFLSLKLESSGVQLQIEDNGSGFQPESAEGGHLGLGIMRERADEIGATLKIETRPGEGTVVLCSWRNGKPNDR